MLPYGGMIHCVVSYKYNYLHTHPYICLKSQSNPLVTPICSDKKMGTTLVYYKGRKERL